jgi:hypothetical protein
MQNPGITLNVVAPVVFHDFGLYSQIRPELYADRKLFWQVSSLLDVVQVLPSLKPHTAAPFPGPPLRESKGS